MNLTQLIKQNNLYSNEIQTYVQPFSDGSQFFWNKAPSYTQFINDCNGRLQLFFKTIRQNKQLENDSIYFEHEKYEKDLNIDKIRKSNFFQRLSNTYLFCRSYDRTILSTDSNKTFYLCLIEPTQKILDDFKQIKGKFLFIYNQNNQTIQTDNLNKLSIDTYQLIFNYTPIEEYDLFNL